MLKKILFPFTFLLSFLIFSFIVAKLKVPILEGQKFGNIPLERKIQKLIELEKSDGVDAVILGASNTEFGISAQVLSETVTQATGKKFVAYNFGTGGADFYLLADLLKIVELHAKPKYYFLQGYHLAGVDLNTVSEDSLYKKIRVSPVGSFLDYKILDFPRFLVTTKTGRKRRLDYDNTEAIQLRISKEDSKRIECGSRFII